MCRRVEVVEHDARLPRETRQPVIRLICAISGRPQHLIADVAGTRRIDMEPGTVLVVVPCRPVTIAGRDSGSMFNTLIGEHHIAYRFIRRRLGVVVEESYHSTPTRCWPAALDLLNLAVGARGLVPEHPYLVTMARALLELARLESSRAGIDGGGAGRYRAACSAIDEILPLPINRDRIAQIIGVHPTHLSRLCRQHGDDGFSTLVLRRRLRFAWEVMRRDRASVATAGKAAGFASSSYFCQACRRLLGVTPGSLRSQDPATSKIG